MTPRLVLLDSLHRVENRHEHDSVTLGCFEGGDSTHFENPHVDNVIELDIGFSSENKHAISKYRRDGTLPVSVFPFGEQSAKVAAFSFAELQLIVDGVASFGALLSGILLHQFDHDSMVCMDERTTNVLLFGR